MRPVRPGAPADRVLVRAPGRLHLGFLDPDASLGRRFGSLGLVIEHFETVVEMERAERDGFSATPGIDANEQQRARAHLQTLRQRTGLAAALHLRLHRLLPAHAGFGSGTQLALAIGHAFARLHGLPTSSAQLAGWLGRGLRSGIGIAGFDQGGLLLDGGPGGSGSVAPLLARLDFPAHWCVLVALDPAAAGLSGSAEKHALASLPPFPRDAAAEVCHRTLMQVLPGAASGDFAAFAHGITRVQQLLGSHFAPAQGGQPWTSPRVGRLLEWMAEHAVAGIGQSSWGPSGFAVLPGVAEAEALIRQARAAGVLAAGLQLQLACGRNRGAQIDCPPSSAVRAQA